MDALYDLKCDGATKLSLYGGDIDVMRVPGGWIYVIYKLGAHQAVFVPFDNEFQPVPSHDTE